jgi:hypothetical protein
VSLHACHVVYVLTDCRSLLSRLGAAVLEQQQWRRQTVPRPNTVAPTACSVDRYLDPDLYKTIYMLHRSSGAATGLVLRSGIFAALLLVEAA